MTKEEQRKLEELAKFLIELRAALRLSDEGKDLPGNKKKVYLLGCEVKDFLLRLVEKYGGEECKRYRLWHLLCFSSLSLEDEAEKPFDFEGNILEDYINSLRVKYEKYLPSK